MRASSLCRILLAFGATGAVPSHAANNAVAVPSFLEETATSGLDSVYAGDWQYIVGGGVATFDCSGDGYPDMLLAGGEAPAKFYRNVSTRGGALKFVAQKSGLELDKVTGAYPLDVDGDGNTDLVLLRVGENVVMRGLGGCRFERANELWGFDGGDAWSTALAATWERGADWPTIAIGNYFNRNEDLAPWGTCTDNWLHRPLTADGRPQRKFAPPVALKPSFCPLSMLFTDWNRSGLPSLRVSNDREYYKGGQEQLWRLELGKEPTLYTAADGWKFLRIWGMGIASYDLDSDGYPEYFLTSMADNKLQTLASTSRGTRLEPSYADVAYAKGVTAHRPYVGGDWHPSTAWHAEFQDVNNDGLVDLFIAKGNVAEMPDFAAKDPNDLLVQLPDGKFEEVGDKAGVASMAVSRGAALADFNLDGLPDLVVVNRNSPAQLWRNVSADAGGWIEVRLEQAGANRDAIGAWIEVRCGDSKVMRREISVGGGHASGELGWRHFGLGDAGKAEIRVIWPDGTTSGWQSVEGASFYVLRQGKPAQAWTPK
ncbi:CRTAC1 family protein [Mesorhizobium sp. BAC0120]|uniref:CRTAC1 family protein n=1 Tax=Mesorhizobium sp. BAC0120 TaxID=3090670 RepID=UPI00298C441F|nr:CRTAC1 family protein [Mesorhizobium sp. BAC0120]MDW6022034.1 CRTAC1 family protein [Mesorhizobium sp. BAC0120]